MRHLRFVVVATLVLGFGPRLVLATTPFGSTLLEKKDGRWLWPKSESYPNSLVIIGDGGQRHVLALGELFPGDERKLYVSETTAGPLWGAASLSYIVTLDNSDYLTMHFWTGKRLLVRLETGTLEVPGVHAPVLCEADKKEIRSILTVSADALSHGQSPDPRIAGALILAATYGLADVRNQVEKIERYGYGGAMSWGMGPPYAKGFSEKLRENGPETIEGRRLAQLALRRLGFSPQGYPQIVFEEHRKDEAISPAERWHKVAELENGLLSEKVYRLLGPPDYIESIGGEDGGYWQDAWRYDFDGKPDCSLLVAWSEAGKAARILKVTPALWHGDALFSERMRKPVFRPDGSLNGISLYSKEFLGKIEDFVKTKSK